MVKLPQGITDEQAASMLLKGLTVHYLIFSTYPVKKGETVLWHAAAGGVGLIACQWLKALGVTTIAHRRLRRQAGARQGARRRRT
jgi:NADPH2:quinone reductase